MRNRFGMQLNQLNNELIVMGAMCEDAISCAVKYLTENDEKMKESVANAEDQINRKMREIESLCMRLLIQQQPVATDLRVVSSALKMISDMERIGDQAYDISEIAFYVSNSGLSSKTHIVEMAQATTRMVTDCVDSFVKKDLTLAREVVVRDDDIDSLFVSVKNELIDAITANRDDAEALVDLLMIAKYFERIGDHAVNIAQWVIYSIIGEYE
ncbi:MAG TPA: phosphate signaling complex protein PhoU [Candidatus Faeciplasma pullistercoris]|uniref:Phosphate-specific transport system accessory protein PhoU n=1 Tax=Candidatus Faeciplasma pullistercoris TaxID=2840800 RepID=A0A9D1GVJ7_9FIRM|nr:phosphate signaling complex protein PhoU [Candidatus Faeciplasma pullistercoris]